MKRYIIIAATIALGAVVGCKTRQAANNNASANSSATASTTTTTTTNTPSTSMGEQAIVYKTKADYSQYVPVTLSADKQHIVAYPGIKDINYHGKPATPFALKNDYWLDNRGIGPNSAFLEITYKEYAQLKEVPPIADLLKRIKDNDPFVEIYNLGERGRFKDEVTEINDIIEKGGLKKFKKIK